MESRLSHRADCVIIRYSADRIRIYAVLLLSDETFPGLHVGDELV